MFLSGYCLSNIFLTYYLCRIFFINQIFFCWKFFVEQFLSKSFDKMFLMNKFFFEYLSLDEYLIVKQIKLNIFCKDNFCQILFWQIILMSNIFDWILIVKFVFVEIFFVDYICSYYFCRIFFITKYVFVEDFLSNFFFVE